MNRKVALPDNEIIQLYGSGYSLSALGKMFGVHGVTICNRLKENGIERRTPTEHKKGKPHSEQHRINLGKAQIGKVLPNETRKKISDATIGRVPWNKGKRKATHPELSKTGNAGENHWNWKGGVSRLASRLRQSSEYKAWRSAVFTRDRYICQFCEKHKRNLVAHHIISFKTILKLPIDLLQELIWDPNNGYTLCEGCHKEFHQNAS